MNSLIVWIDEKRCPTFLMQINTTMYFLIDLAHQLTTLFLNKTKKVRIYNKNVKNEM